MSIAGLLLIGSAPAAAGEATASIAGGYYPTTTFAPWVTHIESSEGACTASLITPKRVLTAAHCVEGDMHARDWTARVGVRNLDDPYSGETRAITGIAVHPEVYLPLEGAHTNHAFYDVAVMFLRRPVATTPATIGDSNSWGSFATAMGWGHVNYDHDNPVQDPNLRAINLSLGDDSQCNAWINTATQHYYPAIHMCAYDQAGDDCLTHGDSGGPLMVDSGGWKVIGVTSFYPGQEEWGPCGGVSMTGFAWIAGSTLRSWPFETANPGCALGKKRIRVAKRAVRKWKKRAAKAYWYSEWQQALRRVKKAKRKVRRSKSFTVAACSV